MMTTTTRTVSEVPFGAGQPTLRLALERDQAGVAETLELAIGWGEGAAWYAHTARPTLTLPAALVPAIVDALTRIQETTP